MTQINHLFNGEVQLAGWRESHSTGAMVTFWLSDPSDLDAFRRLTSRKGNIAGQRLAMALAEIPDDDDSSIPMVPAIPPSAIPDDCDGPKGGQLSRLAAIMGANPAFQHYVREAFGEDMKTEGECADFIRSVCKITSRAELDHNPKAASIFHERFRKPFVEFNEKNRFAIK